MGRKNITEWRELIKRAIKKGELVKSVDGNAVEDHAAEVSDKLAEILEKCGVSVPVVTVDVADEGADQASEKPLSCPDTEHTTRPISIWNLR